MGLTGPRELAGLPEFEEMFEAGEQADQAGDNAGLQRRDHAGLGGKLRGLGTHVVQEAGERLGWGWIF